MLARLYRQVIPSQPEPVSEAQWRKGMKVRVVVIPIMAVLNLLLGVGVHLTDIAVDPGAYDQFLYIVTPLHAFNASLSEEYAVAGRTSFQPDFLTLADGGVNLEGIISAPFHFALRHLVEVVASLPAQNRLMKWLLTLRILELADELGLDPEQLPDLDKLC